MSSEFRAIVTWGDETKIWSGGQPADQIYYENPFGEWVPTVYQMADFCCDPEAAALGAMIWASGYRDYPDAEACEAAGDDPDDYAVILHDDVHVEIVDDESENES